MSNAAKHLAKSMDDRRNVLRSLERASMALPVPVLAVLVFGGLVVGHLRAQHKTKVPGLDVENRLSVPVTVLVPPGIPNWEEATNDRTGAAYTLYPRNIYEEHYIKAWNECLRQYGVLGRCLEGEIRLEAVGKNTHSIRGVKDGFDDCATRIKSIVSEVNETRLRRVARQLHVDHRGLREGIQDSLAAPVEIAIPATVPVWMLHEDATNRRDILFPASIYRQSYILGWNETLYNFGVKGLAVELCGDAVDVVGYPKGLPLAVSSKPGRDDCKKRISMLLESVPDASLRNLAEQSIPHQQFPNRSKDSDDD